MDTRRSRGLASILAIGVLVVTSRAAADASPDVAPAVVVGDAPPALPGPRLPPPEASPMALPRRWAPRLPEAHPLEYGAMVALGAGAFAMSRVTPVNRHWDYFAPDEAFRGLLRLDDPNARHTVRNISDGLWYASMAYPIVDALFVVGPRTGDVAWQLLIVDGEALALGALETQLLEPTAGRARPFVRGCGKNANYDLDCETSDSQKYESFLSGHTLMSFTGAGLACANHLYLPIYGARAADVAACAGALTMAATEGTMRVMSDRHYMSDVALGALLGFATGYGTPALLRYRRAHAVDAAPLVVLPYASSTGGGAVVARAF